MTARFRWKGATTDITAAFLQAYWPPEKPMYAVLPPQLLQELQYTSDGKAWLVLRPLYMDFEKVHRSGPGVEVRS